MYINRFNGYLYTDSMDYNSFYLIEESRRITGLSLKEGDTLLFQFSPGISEFLWTVSEDSTTNYVLSGTPRAKLKKGIYTYTITNKSDKNYNTTLTVEFNADDKSFSILKSDWLLYDKEVKPLSFWTRQSPKSTPQEIDETKKIISSISGLSDSLTASQKLNSLCFYLLKKIKPHEGAPGEQIKSLSPLNQYKLITSGKEQADCANYSDILHLFANVAGIPCRKIGVAGWVGGVGISGHVFNECFLYDQNRWVFVDLTSQKIAVKNENGLSLNTVDIFHANLSGTTKNLKVITADSSYSRLLVTDYDKLNESEKIHFKPASEFYYIHPDIKDEMTFSETFSEYMSERNHYGIYYAGNKKIDNKKHYAKVFTYKVSLAIIFFWLLMASYKAGNYLYSRFKK